VSETPTGHPTRSSGERAPWWALGLVNGLLFGLATGVYTGLKAGDGLFGVVAGVLGGLAFGAVLGPIQARARRRARPVVDSIPAGRARDVRRAAIRGPVPTEPDVRAAALRVATYRLGESGRFRVPVTVTLGFFLVVEAVVAVLYSPWFWAAAALFAAVLTFHLVQPGRLRRRIELLRAG
jgi:hypothetical protein